MACPFPASARLPRFVSRKESTIVWPGSQYGLKAFAWPESDEYHSATATKTDEAEKLVQAAFEYVCITTENIMLFRKRK